MGKSTRQFDVDIREKITDYKKRCLKNIEKKQVKELSANIAKLERLNDSFLGRDRDNKDRQREYGWFQNDIEALRNKLNGLESERCNSEKSKKVKDRTDKITSNQEPSRKSEKSKKAKDRTDKITSNQEPSRKSEKSKKVRTEIENKNNHNNWLKRLAKIAEHRKHDQGNPFMEFFELLEKNKREHSFNFASMAKDGKEHSLFSMYLSYVVAKILEAPSSEHTFRNSSYYSEFVQQFPLNAQAKIKELLIDYRLTCVSYARTNVSELKMGLFIREVREISGTKAIIVALSNDANAFEVKLTRNGQNFQTQATPLAIAFFEILSAWMGNINSIDLPCFKNQGGQRSFNKFSKGIIDSGNAQQQGFRGTKMNQEAFKSLLQKIGPEKRIWHFYSSNIHPLFINFFLQHLPSKRFPIVASFSLSNSEEGEKRLLFTSSIPLVRDGDGFFDPINGDQVSKDQTINNLLWDLQNKNFDGNIGRAQEYYRLGGYDGLEGHATGRKPQLVKQTTIQPSGVLLKRGFVDLIQFLENRNTNSRETIEMLRTLMHGHYKNEDELLESFLSAIREKGVREDIIQGKGKLIKLMIGITYYAYPSSPDREHWILLMFCAFFEQVLNKGYFHADTIGERFFDSRIQGFFAPFGKGPISGERRRFADIYLTALDSKGNLTHEIKIEIGKYVEPIHFLLTSMPTAVTSREGWPILKKIINFIQCDEATNGFLNYSDIKYYENGQVKQIDEYNNYDLEVYCHDHDRDSNEEFYRGFIKQKASIVDCIPIQDHGVSVESFKRCVEIYQTIEKQQGAVLIHCKAGVGRTGMAAMFIILDRLCANYQEAYTKDNIQISREVFLGDVYSYLLLLRVTRSVHMIQSEEQARTFIEFVEEKWRQLDAFYNGSSANSFLLNIPSHYSAYSVKNYTGQFISLEHGFDKLGSVISFVPNYLFITQQNQDNIQKDYLPFYLPICPKALKKPCFIDQDIQLGQYFLFAFLGRVGQEEEGTLATVYHSFLLMRNNNDFSTVSHLYDRIFFIMTELLREVLYGGRRGFFNCEVGCCNADTVKCKIMGKKLKTEDVEQIMFYYQKHFYDLCHTLDNQKINIYPLHIRDSRFTSFYDARFYSSKNQLIHYEDQRRQFLFFTDNEHTFLQKRWGNSESSTDQCDAERKHLEKTRLKGDTHKDCVIKDQPY